VLAKVREVCEAYLDPKKLQPIAADAVEIKKYVRNQLQENVTSDQMCLKEFQDPFTGEPVVKGK